MRDVSLSLFRITVSLEMVVTAMFHVFRTAHVGRMVDRYRVALGHLAADAHAVEICTGGLMRAMPTGVIPTRSGRPAG